MKNIEAGSRRGILAGGNWLIDYVKVVDRYPLPEQLGNILSRCEGIGGAPHNVLMTLARSGASFPLAGAGLLGNDPAGNEIIDICRRNRIDTHLVQQTSEAPTSYTDVMTEQKSGRRTFFHDRGANALWRGDRLDFERTLARIFHFGYFLLLDEMDKPDAKFGTRAGRMLAAARAAGLKTSVDAVTLKDDRFLEVVPPALKHADYCIINEIEAGEITGHHARSPKGALRRSTLVKAAECLLELGVLELAVIHFPEGAVACARDGRIEWQASLKLPPSYIRGTAGAGDAFCAGVLFGLHEGWGLRRCLLTGTCIAGACLSHPTTTGGIGSLRQSLALAGKFGFRTLKG